MDYPITVPGVGLSAGKFTNGNPLASLAASLDPAEWANAVTDEILNVITQGGLTPTENTNTQLATAIRNMINGGDYKPSVRFTTTANIVLTGLGTQAGGDWGAALTAGERILVKNQTAGAENGIWIAAAGAWTRATDADTGAELNSGAIIPVESGTLNADTNWQLTTDGTVVIGTTGLAFQQLGTLSDASTTTKGKVQLATSAEAQAFSDAFKAITPATLAAALQSSNQSLAVNGYQKLPGGIIIQWGSSASIAQSGFTPVTFPLTFPTAALSVTVGNKVSGSNSLVYSGGFYGLSASGFNATNNSGTSGVLTVTWIAIGY